MNVKSKQDIRTFTGKKIGTIYTDYNGDKEVRDFYGRLLGRYNKKSDVTRDFYGRIVSRGDNLTMFLAGLK